MMDVGGGGDGPPQVPAPLVVTTTHSYSKYLLSGLYGLRKGATFTDFVIKAQGKQIQCHKVILVGASPFFSSMLNSGLQESKLDEVSLDQYDYELLNKIVDYIYSGNIVIPYKQITNIIDISEFLQLPDLKEECAEYITRELDSDNCIGWYRESNKYQLDKVMAHCLTLFTHSLDDICMGEEFKSLDLDDMLMIVQKSIEGVESDVKLKEHALIAVMEWIKYEPETRNLLLMEIISKISLRRFEKQDIAKVRDQYQRTLTLRNYKMICDEMSKKYMDIISDFQMLHTVDEDLNSNETCMISRGLRGTSEQGTEPCLVVLGGSTTGDKLNEKCWCLRDSKKTWDELTELPKECQLYFNAICQYEDGFVVMGGLNREGHEVSKSCHKFNAKLNQWSKMPDMHTRRYGAGAGSCDGIIYIFGGRDEYRMPLNTIEYFDTKSQTWTYASQVLKAGYLPVVSSSLDAVYVHCNFNKIGNSKKGRSGLFWYNIHKAMSGNTPLNARVVPSSQGAAMASIDGHMFIVGGSQKSIVTVTLDQSKPIFPEKTFACVYHHNFGSVVALSPHLFISGGYRGEDPTDHIEVINVVEKKEKPTFLRLPLPLGNHFSCILNLPKSHKSEF